MAQLDDVDDEIENHDNDFDIPDGLIGSKNPRQPPQKKTIDTIPVVKRRRGRPPNSRSKVNTIPLATEKLWVEGAAIILSTTSALFAAKVMSDTKYVMTPAESRSAAGGVVYVLFQYKQIREFALLVRTDSPTAVIVKGFWPYISRVFVKDIIENVIAGLVIPKRQSKSESAGDKSIGANGKSPTRNDESNTVPNFSSWRDI